MLDQHANGTVGSSTFRRVLASFLWEERGWHPQCTRAGKLTLPAEDNRELTDWIGTHLKVNWIVVEEPWRWESQAIQALGPPLNVRENAAHEFNATVRRMRSQFAAAATLKPT